MTASTASASRVQPETSTNFTPYGVVEVCVSMGWTRERVSRNSRRLPRDLRAYLLAAFDAVNAERMTED